MGTSIKELRKRIGINQTEFAGLLGCSYPSVQNYEAGRKPPAAIMEKLQALALQHGHADLAAQFGVEFAVKHLIHPGETLISSRAHGDYPYNRQNKKWHDMLEQVLESGNQKAINAVIPNLEVFSDYAGTYPHKKGDRKKREIG